MKKTLFAIMVSVMVSTPTMAADREIKHSLSLSNPDKVAKLEVSLSTGSIVVEGYDGKQIEVSAKVKNLMQVKSNDERHQSKTARSSEGLKKVENKAVYLEIEEDNNEVEIESLNRNQNIALTVKVPFNTNLEIDLHRGEDIKINNVRGEIEVSNHSGAITAVGVRGPIVAEAMRHDLVVVFDEFTTKKPSSLNVHRGNIDVTLPKQSKLTVEVKTYQGEIYSGLETEFKSVDIVEKNDSGRNKKVSFGGAMAATLNKGTQKLHINTFRGDIYLRNK